MAENRDLRNLKLVAQTLFHVKKFYKYEPWLIIKAFNKTVKYFLDNGIEFEFKNFFRLKQMTYKEMARHNLGFREFTVTPEHKMCKIEFSNIFKDFLNRRNGFEDRENIRLMSKPVGYWQEVEVNNIGEIIDDRTSKKDD